MPEITKEEAAFLEAAKARCADYKALGHYVDQHLEGMMNAYDALPKPYQPLLPERLGPEISAAYMRAVARRLDEGKILWEHAPDCLRAWAVEEEKLAKGE